MAIKNGSDDVDVKKESTTPSETQTRVATQRAITRGRKTVEKNFAHLETLKIEYVDMRCVIPNKYNPNRQNDHDFELLVRSMEEDGFTQPILVNVLNEDGTGDPNRPITIEKPAVIVDGEHRWRAAQVLHLKEIPVVRTTMTAEQARISTIRHNRARGTHDVDLESSVLRDLRDLGMLDVAADSLMLDAVELQLLLDDIPAPEALAGETFEQAWVPESFTNAEADLVRTGKVTAEQAETLTADGGVYAMAGTGAAIDLQRKRLELIDRAKTEGDRLAARAETQIYRINLMFSNEEAKIVKSVLGGVPAVRLLEICAYLIEHDMLEIGKN